MLPALPDTLRPDERIYPDVAGAAVVKWIRRVIGSVTLAAAVAAAIRTRGTGGTPPQHGGWRPLDLPER